MRYVLLGAATLLIAAASSRAQEANVSLPADGIVAIRKSLMDLQQGVAAAMKAGVDNKENVKQFEAGAKGLLSSSHVIPALFPAGTEKADNTKAKPEIWSDKAGFEKASENLASQAEKLVALASADDKAGFATQFAEVGKACGACHRQYRYQQ